MFLSTDDFGWILTNIYVILYSQGRDGLCKGWVIEEAGLSRYDLLQAQSQDAKGWHFPFLKEIWDLFTLSISCGMISKKILVYTTEPRISVNHTGSLLMNF
jgi:hypothetical protein